MCCFSKWAVHSELIFQDRRSFNPLVAAFVGARAGVLEDSIHCFALAVSQEFDDVDPDDLLTRGRVREVCAYFLRDESGLERVCWRYIELLEDLGIGSREFTDPDLLADYAARVLISEAVPPRTYVTHFWLDWALSQDYLFKRRYELAPIHFFLQKKFISASQFLCVVEVYSAAGASAGEFPVERCSDVPSQWLEAVIHFLSANDPIRVRPPSGSITAPLAEKFCPFFELKARNSPLPRYSRLIGCLVGDRRERLELAASEDGLRALFPDQGDEVAIGDAIRRELLVKAYMIRRSRESFVQGLPASLHRAIISTLRLRRRVVSVRDLREITGTPSILVDPFDVLPGEIVAYSPGGRFLRGDSVSFALRDWVETADLRRDRIAKIRILTPLRDVLATTSAAHVLGVLQADPLWSTFGIASLGNSRFVEVRYYPHETAWIMARNKKMVRQIVTGQGHYVWADLVFDRARWAGYSFPRSHKTNQARGDVLRDAAGSAIGRGVNAAEVSERLSELVALMESRSRATI